MKRDWMVEQYVKEQVEKRRGSQIKDEKAKEVHEKLGKARKQLKKKFYQEFEVVLLKKENKLAVVIKLEPKNVQAIVSYPNGGEQTVKFADIDKVSELNTNVSSQEFRNAVIHSNDLLKQQKQLLLDLWIQKADEEDYFKDKTITYWAKLREDAKIPTRRDEDGWYDIYACFDEEEIEIPPHGIVKIGTGITSAFHKDYRFSVDNERGSTGQIGMLTVSGKIDSGYRGEWKIAIHNSNNHPIAISKGVTGVSIVNGVVKYPYTKAICQAGKEIVPKDKNIEITFDELEKIPSVRGKNGWGSSSK